MMILPVYIAVFGVFDVFDGFLESFCFGKENEIDGLRFSCSRLVSVEFVLIIIGLILVIGVLLLSLRIILLKTAERTILSVEFKREKSFIGVLLKSALLDISLLMLKEW
jgi:hypothetical protein